MKSLEVGFRRFVLFLLKVLVRRGKPLPGNIDFNRCKFLFARQDRIGDILVSTPVVHLLKQRFPDATVDFLLSTKNYFVLDNEQLVRKRWVYTKKPRETWALLRAIRRERYDFVVDLWDSPSTTSTVVCALAGARWNVGLAKENDFVYDIVVPAVSRKDTHIVDRIARLLVPFGIDGTKANLTLHYATSSSSQMAVESFMKRHDMLDKFLLGMNISAGSDTRFWGVPNFQELLRRLLHGHPEMPVLILYKPGERDRAEAIAGPFRHVTLSPETESFDLFAAFVQKLGLLVTPDTSAVHLAVAFRVPSVVLYVQSNLELGIWSPYRTESETLVTHVDDLTTISCDDVHAAVNRLIRRIRPDVVYQGDRISGRS